MRSCKANLYLRDHNEQTTEAGKTDMTFFVGENCRIRLLIGHNIDILLFVKGGFYNQVNSSLGAWPGHNVHQTCPLNLIRPKNPSSTPDDEVAKDTARRRSTELKFNSSEHCVFCGQSAKYKGRGLMLFPYEGILRNIFENV